MSDLDVVRARALGSHLVRVVFDEEPRHKSAAGRTDSLNPANYSFSVVEGDAQPLQSVGVDPEPAQGPTIALGTGEWGVDVHTDRPLVVGITYKVTVNGVTPAIGGALGIDAAEFFGILRLQRAQPLRRDHQLWDFSFPIAQGAGYQFDHSGDIKVHAGVEALRKRVLRRVTTPKGGFTWMQNYGADVALKETASLAQLQALKADLTRQVRSEPDVSACKVGLSLDPRGVLTITFDVKMTSVGSTTFSLQVDPSGEVS